MPLSTALVIAGALVAVSIALGWLLRKMDGRRRSGGDLRLRAEDLALAPTATLVQFSTEMCTRCPQVRRLLRDIAGAHAGVEVAEIDLTHRNDLATRYRVLQTPTTFLVDASGIVISRWGGLPDRAAINDALESVLNHQPQEQQ